jgi:hypothetical protein
MHLLVCHGYINEMRGSRSKIPSKNLVRQRYTEGFNSGVKELMNPQFARYIFQKSMNIKFNENRSIRSPVVPYVHTDLS